jgi:hypothetical protein
MSAPLPDSIVQTIGRKFLRRDQAEVLALLGEYQCTDQALRERVLQGIISLAGRDVGRVKHFLDCAREDYRNVILWSEHADQSRQEFFKP